MHADSTGIPVNIPHPFCSETSFVLSTHYELFDIGLIAIAIGMMAKKRKPESTSAPACNKRPCNKTRQQLQQLHQQAQSPRQQQQQQPNQPHAVLSAYFPELATLRSHVIARVAALPSTPARRNALRKLEPVGQRSFATESPNGTKNTSRNLPLDNLLDSALVGLSSSDTLENNSFNMNFDDEASSSANNRDGLSQSEVC